jgi:hypothetical protein
MPPDFPNTNVKSVASWSNYSGTISNRPIPVYCTPQGGTDVSILRSHGDAIRSILRYCFTQNPPASLRSLGSTWSFSRIIEPGGVVLDPANLTYIERVPPELFSPAYQTRAGQGFAPMFIEGGTQIASINRRLASDVRLALQTSGAGDGHRLAGCIATGTHGSAIGIGALHDTVLGVYLVVGPDRALFVQAASAPFAGDATATWLQGQTGIPTATISDDEALGAVLVSLGSLGVVFGAVVETVPLYRFKVMTFGRLWNDPQVWTAIRTLDTSALHPDVPDAPYHFGVVMHPYPPDGGNGAFVTMMWKTAADGVAATTPFPGIPVASSDLMGLVSKLTQALGGRLTAGLELKILQGLITEQLGSGAASNSEGFPGEVFGPTTLPPGTGASTEIVVNQVDAERALKVVYSVLDQLKARGLFLLGGIGVRFVPQTKSLLGMNIFPMNCYIELPSIRNDDVLSVYKEVWNAIEQAGIAFTCHWGQLHGMTPARLANYFGNRAVAWKGARAQLLDETGRKVFAAPILSEVGLDA